MMNEQKTIHDLIQDDINENPVLLFMKGDKEMPMCGFSARVVDLLRACGTAFETRNVLDNEALRQGIKEFSDWPTIPQLYIRGEFIGGCDIVTTLYESGELEKLLKN